MFSDQKILVQIPAMAVAVLFIASVAVSCSPLKRYTDVSLSSSGLQLSIPDETSDIPDRFPVMQESEANADTVEGPVIMKAIRDSETGEMTATDVIPASRVVARFRNIAERLGRISFSFDVMVPQELISSDFQLRLVPEMKAGDETISLKPVFITGALYRKRQLKGYERYRQFLESIVIDSTAFIRMDQLETFLQRYFPDTYAMKSDSSVLSVPEAENLFGVNQMTALEHYTRQLRKRRNEWKMENKDSMFRKLVKAPMEYDVRLDTVMSSGEGSLIYRYSHTMASSPGLKKLEVSLSGMVFRDGVCVAEMPAPGNLSFYISSLSSLADNTPRFLFKVIQRTVSDRTVAFLDFDQGSAVLDTLREGNASELERIRKCFADIRSRKDLVLDSIEVTASCSPEGSWEYNAALAEGRAKAVRHYVTARIDWLDGGAVRSASVPENWDYLQKLVLNDTLISEADRKAILELSGSPDKDMAERRMASMESYRYLREKIYPRLRTVKFHFYMHRPHVKKDTIHTRIPDTLYMRGLEALKNLDYRKAAALLGPYRDYNAALAMASSGYDSAAISILSGLGSDDARSDYLLAVLYSRAGDSERAEEYFLRSSTKDPAMRHRANLDPELSAIAAKAMEDVGY